MGSAAMGACLDEDEGRGGETSLARLRLWGCLACWLLFASTLWACGDPSSTEDEVAVAAPERIILIVADTLRRDHLSPYGSELETPAVARLARRGQVFTNAVSSFHQTTMSMAALFTGRTPSDPWTTRSV